MNSSNAIEARGLGKTFGSGSHAFRALHDVSLAIRRNEFFTLLGPSGCGKTTILRMIAGFEYPTEGSLLLNGTDLASLPPYRRPVNTVFQNYALFPHMSVAENIGFGLTMQKRPKAEIARRVDETLALVRMESLRDRATSAISGGQQQRVALARALAPSPEVLLLDEPLSALDYKLRKEMQIELKRMQEETGITFIFVTHDQEEALTMSDRIAVMSAGKILQTGTPHDIYERPAERFVASFIGESNFLQGRLLSTSPGHATVELDAGGKLVATRLEPAGTDADVAASIPPATGRVSLVIRPEHAVIVNAVDKASLTGTLENIVYSGTDTHFHVRLADDTAFIVRTQNRRGGEVSFKPGQSIGVRVQEAAAQLLRD